MIPRFPLRLEQERKGAGTMQKLSQTEELARTLAARARHHALTPEQISRAMDEQDYDVAQLDELYTALEDRGVHLTEEEADLPALDETQIGRLEHELSAEGVALDDPVKAYLKEIGRVPLLTAAPAVIPTMPERKPPKPKPSIATVSLREASGSPCSTARP